MPFVLITAVVGIATMKSVANMDSLLLQQELLFNSRLFSFSLSLCVCGVVWKSLTFTVFKTFDLLNLWSF